MRPGLVLVAFAVFSFATAAPGKGGSITKLTKAEFEETIPVCEGEADCKAKWEAAQLWIVHNSAFKLQTATDVLLETFSPGRSDARLAARVTKEPLGGGRYRLLVSLWCNNIFGCVPDGWQAALAFNREIGAVAVPVTVPTVNPPQQLDQLERLARLKEQGALTQEEFDNAKKDCSRCLILDRL
ncbi:MAG: SHOCT domain-containing protein [Acidobacteriota bacterium]